MAAKTWEEIKAGNTRTRGNILQVKEVDLCDTWGQVPGKYGAQYVFCRRPRGHTGLHTGMQDPHTKIGWA